MVEVAWLGGGGMALKGRNFWYGQMTDGRWRWTMEIADLKKVRKTVASRLDPRKVGMQMMITRLGSNHWKLGQIAGN